MICGFAFARDISTEALDSLEGLDFFYNLLPNNLITHTRCV